MSILKTLKKEYLFMSIIAEKQENQKQVLILNEISKRKIVEHNDLITSVAKMDKTPLKIFELAVSCIDTENLPENNTILLSKRELFAFFKVDDSNKHSRFKESIRKLQKQSYFEIKEEQGKGVKFKSIVPIPYVEWTDYNDEVKIEFHREIMPYLIELKQNFTQYSLSDLMELNSKYSIIIYKWLSMFYNQYEHYSTKGGRRNEQLKEYRNPSISIQELRTITDTVNEHQHFPHFENRVLKKAIEEINEHTHFNVSYEKIKKGRSIDSIQFFITKKKIAKNENYKQEQQDEDYLKGKAKKEAQKQQLFAQAIVSKYTTLLLETALLSPYEMQNIDIMADLQRMVYPYYEELETMQGANGVKKHLSYVSMKREDYSKKNIALYLKKSITGYLETLKFRENTKK